VELLSKHWLQLYLLLAGGEVEMPGRRGHEAKRGLHVGKKDHYKRTPKRQRGQMHVKKEASRGSV
jgi:hypothetical protein